MIWYKVEKRGEERTTLYSYRRVPYCNCSTRINKRQGKQMIILKHIDGSIAIMELAPGADKDDAIKKFKEAHAGMYVEHHEGVFALPKSREHRDAWTFSNNRVIIDKNKLTKGEVK